MPYQAKFIRHEMKYMITLEQKERLLKEMEPYMSLDKYGRSTIRNVYFDTDSYRLIRHSIEKPAYKEKLRLRSYCQAEANCPIFVELKKKYQDVVYKRRISMPEISAMDWLGGRAENMDPCQIAREIAYFRSYYRSLHPKMFLSYEREAYYCREGGDFRVTFDDLILCRQTELSLGAELGGIPLLEADTVLMELKTAGGIPLWMTHILSREKIYKTSFSKYGTAYERLILPNFKGGCLYA